MSEGVIFGEVGGFGGEDGERVAADEGEVDGCLGFLGSVAEVEEEDCGEKAGEDVDAAQVVGGRFVAGAVEEDEIGGYGEGNGEGGQGTVNSQMEGPYAGDERVGGVEVIKVRQLACGRSGEFEVGDLEGDEEGEMQDCGGSTDACEDPRAVAGNGVGDDRCCGPSSWRWF